LGKAAVRRFGILTSGGDCPGLNAAIRGVARAALGEQARDIGSRMAEARASTTAEQMKLAQQATGELASQALAGKGEERAARGEQYGVMMNQYDQARCAGQGAQQQLAGHVPAL
jgi:6-phosphofructokinase 1